MERSSSPVSCYHLDLYPLTESLWALSPVFLWRALCKSLNRVLVIEKGVVEISWVQQRRKGFHAPAGLLCPKRIINNKRHPCMLVNLFCTGIKKLNMCHEFLRLVSYTSDYNQYVIYTTLTCIHYIAGTHRLKFIPMLQTPRASFWHRCETLVLFR